MMRPRRSLEEGHLRKILVVVDETPECARAVGFAARRAARTGGALVLLYVIAPADFQHWLGVESIMRAEAEEHARQRLLEAVDRARELGVEPEFVLKEGKRAEEIERLIDEDEDIAVLVLAAGTESEGPGPLVTNLVGKRAGSFPVPITIVPGHLDEAALDTIA